MDILHLIKAINDKPGSKTQGELEWRLLKELECATTIPLFAVKFGYYKGQALNFPHSEGAGCIVKTITGDLFRIRNWLVVKNLMTQNTLEGTVFQANTSKIPTGVGPLFAIKIPGSLARTSAGIIHEAVVGLYCLNKIRQLGIPNFAYVYGVFLCNKPIIKEGKVASWCTGNDNPVAHLVEENVVGVPLAQLIPTLSVADFELIFWQILNALRAAYHLYEYTHYDLHVNNIIVRDMKKPHAIPLYGKEGFIVSRYVPVIIDYGFSRFVFEHKGERVSLGKYDQYNINPHEANPAADVYRFLIFSAHYSLENKFTNDGHRACGQVPRDFQFPLEIGNPNDNIINYVKTKILFFKIGSLGELLNQRRFSIDIFVPVAGYDLILDDPLFAIKPSSETNISTVISKDAGDLMIEFYENMTNISSLFEYCDAWKIVETVTIVDREPLKRQLNKISETSLGVYMRVAIFNFSSASGKVLTIYNHLDAKYPNTEELATIPERDKSIILETEEIIFQMEMISDAMSCVLKITAERHKFVAEYTDNVSTVQNVVRANGRRRMRLFFIFKLTPTPKMIAGHYN